MRYLNVKSKKCLGVPDASTETAEQLVQSSCSDVTANLWQLQKENTSDGRTWYSIRNRNSDMCLSVDAARSGDGAPATQYICGLYPDQFWSFRYDRSHHGWQILSRNSGKCLAVQDSSAADQAPVVQWECGGSDDQYWRL